MHLTLTNASRYILLRSMSVSLLITLIAAEPVTAASIESVGALANTGQLPGAAAGAMVNGNASGYAEITWNGQFFTGQGQTRYTAAGATVTNDNPPASTFATPTRGMKTGFGDTKPKIAPSSLTALDTIYQAQTNNAIAVGRGDWNATANANTLSATAIVTRGYTGYAAGYASDPYTVSAGSYLVRPVLDGGLLLSTNTADLNSNATLVFSAQSTGLGSANATLWTLTLSLTGSSAPVVGFTSAPILGLDDMTVEDDLLNALDVTAGQVTFDPEFQAAGYDLFSTTLSSSSAFQFGDQFEASALSTIQSPDAPAPAPEPATYALSAVALIALASFRRRKCKRS